MAGLMQVGTGTSNATMTFIDGQLVSPYKAVGCACRGEDFPPWGCVAEYDVPGLGAVVPLAALVEAERVWRERRHYVCGKCGWTAHLTDLEGTL